MISEFSVKNFRGFENWISLNLKTDKKYEFNEHSISKEVAQHIAIYGENGEGKTNLGFAILDIIGHLGTGQYRRPDFERTYLNADSSSELAEFKYTFHLNEIELEYHYGKNSEQKISYERLLANGKEVLSWNKDNSMQALINLEGADTLDNSLSDNISSLITYVANNAKLTSSPVNDSILELLEFVNGMVFLKTLEDVNQFIGHKVSDHKSMSEVIIKEYGLDALQSFLNEHGINCELKDHEDLDGSLKIAQVSQQRNLEFFRVASSGTFSLVILFVWLKKMESGKISFAFIDEFDAFYHHKLAVDVAKLISNSQSQTIMSSHNTSIMSNSILRPDCYFTIQDGEVKPLYMRSDRELRKAHNLEKMYRSGVFNE